MPQNTKDSKGGKNKPVKDTGTTGSKGADQAAKNKSTGSVTGANHKGEKKTTP